jgi:hypothetical protein
MNQICTDPQYRDILTLVLTQIKDIGTYRLFLSVCTNMKDVLLGCKSISSFLVRGFTLFVPVKLGVVEVIGNKIQKEIQYSSSIYPYSILSVKIYNEFDADSYSYYYYEETLKQVTYRDETISYNFVIDGQLITDSYIDYSATECIHRIGEFHLIRDSGKWIVNVYNIGKGYWSSRSLDSLPDYSKQIPVEFIQNGATYFETKHGIEHLDQIKQFTIPFINKVRYGLII